MKRYLIRISLIEFEKPPVSHDGRPVEISSRLMAECGSAEIPNAHEAWVAFQQLMEKL